MLAVEEMKIANWKHAIFVTKKISSDRRVGIHLVYPFTLTDF